MYHNGYNLRFLMVFFLNIYLGKPFQLPLKITPRKPLFNYVRPDLRHLDNKSLHGEAFRGLLVDLLAVRHFDEASVETKQSIIIQNGANVISLTN